MEILKLSFHQIRESIVKKQLTAQEVTKFFLERIHKIDNKINSFITIHEQAIEDAKLIDQKIARGQDPGRLAGVPFGIKDMLCTKGIRTTAASRILENFVPPYDSTVVKRLKDEGAIILGKLNQDEFAMGSSSETSYFGAVKNPWNMDCVPGGSSGGSAAAQAARLVAGSIGTDTGGSIRQPASFCGVVGVKPTYGRISRYGIVAYASSLDQAGPMTNSVEDAALSLEVLCGRDHRDSTTSDRPVPSFSQTLNKNIRGIRVGLLKEFMSDGVDAEVQKCVDSAVLELKKMGAEVVQVSVPLTTQAVPIYYLVAASEASSNLARYDGVKYGFRSEFKDLASLGLDEFYSQTRGEGFGKEVQRRIMLGTYCLSSGYYDAYYSKACQVRRLLKNQFDEAFKSCDVILSPVTTSPAFKIGSRISDPLQMYMNDIFTVSTNLAGLPGLSLPFRRSTSGLPIGVQLTAGAFQEERLLGVAAALEDASPEKGAMPNV